MATEIPVKGEAIGGILDPTIDRSYYSLVPCPRLECEVELAEHRSCENFRGLHVDPDTGAHLLYCGFGDR